LKQNKVDENGLKIYFKEPEGKGMNEWMDEAGRNSERAGARTQSVKWLR